MLQRAVDIHFELNYRHLCAGSDEQDQSKSKSPQATIQTPPAPKSSLVDDEMTGNQEESSANQIDSTMKNEDASK